MSGSALIARGYSPYWKPFDGIDGKIWDQADDGSVATVALPGFEFGWDYRILMRKMKKSVDSDINIGLAFGSGTNEVSAFTNYGADSYEMMCHLEFEAPMVPAAEITVDTKVSFTAPAAAYAIRHTYSGGGLALCRGAALDTLTGISISAAAGVFNGGQVLLFRRKSK